MRAGSSPSSARAAGTRRSIADRGVPRFSRPNATSSSTSSSASCASGSWNSKPTWRVSWLSEAWRVSWPSTRMRPASQCASTLCGISPFRQSARVLLPAPLGPSRSSRSPGAHSSETSRRAGARRPMWRTVSRSTWIAGAATGQWALSAEAALRFPMGGPPASGPSVAVLHLLHPLAADGEEAQRPRACQQVTDNLRCRSRQPAADNPHDE